MIAELALAAGAAGSLTLLLDHLTSIPAPSRATSTPARRTPMPAKPANQPGASVPEAAPGLEVRVLGPVEVQAAGSRLGLTPRLLEALVYLAVHPEGASEDQLRTALWREQPSTGQAMRNLLWQLRRHLGTDGDGELFFPHIGRDGRYRLHPGVVCDLHHLDPPAVSAEAARTALAAVRGRPFEVRRGFDWAHAEGHVSWAERRIAILAAVAVEAALAEADPATAVGATEQALRALPEDQRIYRLLLQAHAAAGDRLALERVITRLLAQLGPCEDPTEELEPETVELYQQLTGRPNPVPLTPRQPIANP